MIFHNENSSTQWRANLARGRGEFRYSRPRRFSGGGFFVQPLEWEMSQWLTDLELVDQLGRAWWCAADVEADGEFEEYDSGDFSTPPSGGGWIVSGAKLLQFRVHDEDGETVLEWNTMDPWFSFLILPGDRVLPYFENPLLQIPDEALEWILEQERATGWERYWDGRVGEALEARRGF